MSRALTLLESTPPLKEVEIYGAESPSSLAVYLGLYNLKGPHILQVSEALFDEIEQSFYFFNPHQTVYKLPSIDPWFPPVKPLSERLRWLYGAASGRSSDIFLCSKASLSQKTLPSWFFLQQIKVLKIGGRLPSKNTLLEMGYTWSLQTVSPGEFCLRGGFLDVFSPAHSYPIRVEAEGDSIKSVRLFCPQTGKTLVLKKSFSLLPFYEIPFSSEFRLKSSNALKRLKTKFPRWQEDLDFYLNKISKNLFFPEASLMADFIFKPSGTALDFFSNSARLWIFEEKIKKTYSPGDLPSAHPSGNSKESSFLDFLAAQFFFKTVKINIPRVIMNSLISEKKNIWPFQILKNLSPLKPLESFRPRAVFISTAGSTQSKLIENQIEKQGFKAETKTALCTPEWSEWKEEQLRNPEVIHLISSFLPYHFKTAEYVFIRGDKWLGKPAPEPAAVRGVWSSFSKERAFSFAKISKGDLIVDKTHGVGRFSGLKKMVFNNIQGEYVELEYQSSARLYIPVYRLGRLFQFKSQLGDKALDQLGKPYWAKKKESARKSLQNSILDLLRIYSARKNTKRPSFPSSSSDFIQFEKDFPFEETKDQNTAIQDVLADLQKPYPMDRVLLGDSGVGKTEVALRAVFKAVESGFQTAVLAPTTILSLQHFESFKKRLESWPFRVELINRFISSKKINLILADLLEQKVDILIGSHRLLSSDVRFKNLGLIVIDEEHRFGVKQKEKLKKLKINADCLSLSATPIPRTLNMCLSGAKDLSLIQTAPKNRIPPQVFVTRFQKEKIKNAIQRELQRGGQTLFIHNRVQSLKTIFEKIKTWVPNARILMAHGQMNAGELESNVVDFFNHHCDLLVCTAIVETGMDFSRVNTIIVNDAQKLGLSQLYQLRGRVGRRANIASYCYFVVPESFSNLAPAADRLNFLQTQGDLNSGYQAARYDLESRGGGEFLGSKQSGHLENIGYDLYLEMLEESLAPEKNISLDPEIHLPWPAYFPSSYIPHDKLKLMYYKYLADMERGQNIHQLEEELQSNFGPPPEEVKNLFGCALIRLLCRELKIRELKVKVNHLYLTFESQNPETIKMFHGWSRLQDQKIKTKLTKNFSWIHVHEKLQELKAFS